MSDQLSFKDAVAQLPSEQQQAMQGWLGMQMFIADNLGLEREKWFEYLDWAFENPFDYSFMGQGLDMNAMAERGEKAASVLGGEKRDLSGVPKLGEEARPAGTLRPSDFLHKKR